MPEFYHSNFATFDAWLHAERAGGTHILVKAPITKFKASNLLDLAALGLAPFTGGLSALGMAGLRGAQAARTAGKVGVSGKKAAEAQAAKTAAQKVPQRSATAETQSKLYQDMASAGENRTDMAQIRARAANPVPEVSAELQQEATQHNAKRLQGINEATEAAAEAEKNLEQLQSTQGEKTQAAGAGALVGVQSSATAGQTNAQKQQEEMKRIENLAQEGRAKAGTGTGGKVAVSA